MVTAKPDPVSQKCRTLCLARNENREMSTTYEIQPSKSGGRPEPVGVGRGRDVGTAGGERLPPQCRGAERRLVDGALFVEGTGERERRPAGLAGADEGLEPAPLGVLLGPDHAPGRVLARQPLHDQIVGGRLVAHGVEASPARLARQAARRLPPVSDELVDLGEVGVGAGGFHAVPDLAELGREAAGCAGGSDARLVEAEVLGH